MAYGGTMYNWWLVRFGQSRSRLYIYKGFIKGTSGIVTDGISNLRIHFKLLNTNGIWEEVSFSSNTLTEEITCLPKWLENIEGFNEN